MKALILAAGFGTRLLPYTRVIPKPLFTIGSLPVLGHTINLLVRSGCRQIIINTHYLPDLITDYIENSKEQFKANIRCIYEPEILGTGGAIANVKDFMADQDFFVINADVATSLDLTDVYNFHVKKRCLATLVLHDRKAFNKVAVYPDGWITGFNHPGKGLAFTGIQVLSPQIFDYMPDRKVFSSIDLFAGLCKKKQVAAYVADNIFWEDMGTQAAYARTARQWMGAAVLKADILDINICNLAGDGSDRTWFRAVPKTLSKNKKTPGSAVICDHGICLPGSDTRAQLEAFVHIGTHLFKQKVPVPAILSHDAFAGLVVLEDLGDTHLADLVQQAKDRSAIKQIYRQVIDLLILFSKKGADGFDPAWTCQTPTYSRSLILEKECQYFMDAFVNGYMGKHLSFDDVADAFSFVAQKALKGGLQGLMHRDCQSRNIMVKNNTFYFIDFQSARTGPVQYDLASLLIDPYVTLPMQVQKDLVSYAMDRQGLGSGTARHEFTQCFHFCCLTRNMQMLGAFAHLSRAKKKTGFEAYIPAAVASLKQLIQNMEPYPVMTSLKELIMRL
ncbi:MAG: phosphotransferase [Desulfotignum sp.]|nr:phosphotransferase [Desulfotignum sp.]MCF8124723.1 phosphotransferase [Desulfotignum sp.]